MITVHFPTKIILFSTWILGWRTWISVYGFQTGWSYADRIAASFSGAAIRRVSPCLRETSFGDDSYYPSSDTSTVLQDHTIKALDLIPLLQIVARHAGTRRGHQALLAIVKEDDQSKTRRVAPSKYGQFSSRRMRVSGLYQSKQSGNKRKSAQTVTVAQSVEEAKQQYTLVETATLALSNDNGLELTYPPLYGADSHPCDTSKIEDTDNDEWLSLPADLWTLEHLLQVEKVLETLIATKEWANREETQLWMPRLAEIGAHIDKDNVLPDILDEIADRVEIVRVQTSSEYSTTPGYYFRLKVDRYPILKILRNKEEKLVKAGAKEFDTEVMALREEIANVEGQVRGGLAQLTLSVADVIDKGLDTVARLDTIFAMAAFGVKTNGAIPKMLEEGTIDIDGFIHPVLSSNDGFSSSATAGQSGHVIPVDLKLTNEQGHRALLISGPNGGGKTLSMKSFGLVCILAKLGIPIPTVPGAARPRVDFVHSILINVGDKQNVIQGESTWTSSLNSCSRMLDTVRCNSADRHIVLLDELGSGTDPEAGGAIGQAILEEFLSVHGCQVVATTHSPRLKTLSFESDNFSCASVLLEIDATATYKRPSFRLEYGVIGESYALGAASRCTPKLPDTILSRASQLLSQNAEDDGKERGDYIQTLLSSMEEQMKRSQQERKRAEQLTHDIQRCREATISLASSYELHLERVEQRLEDMYGRLRENKSKNDLQVIGDTLAELKLTKKRIRSQKEILEEKGLKPLPLSYALSVGESVVVIESGSDWEVSPVEVVADWTTEPTLSRAEVMVRESSLFTEWDEMFVDDYLDVLPYGVTNETTYRIVQRHELAIWNDDNLWGNQGLGGTSSMTKSSTSIPNSKQRLTSLLSTLKTETTKSDSSNIPSFGSPKKPTKIKKSFLSARARKAVTNKKKK